MEKYRANFFGSGCNDRSETFDKANHSEAEVSVKKVEEEEQKVEEESDQEKEDENDGDDPAQ